MSHVEGYHLQVKREDMEIVKRVLESLAIEVKIPEKADFSLVDIFSVITKALNAKLVVELGTGMGFSCSAFISALKETGGILYSVDINPEAADVKPTIQKYSGTDAPVIFIQGDSVTVGRAWIKGDIDVLYCDSDHTYGHVLTELETWARYHPKIILVHDTLVRGGEINEPYKAIKEYAEREGKPFVNLTFTEGLGITT